MSRGHRQRNLSDSVVITNRCPVCLVVFSDVKGARRHVQRTLERGFCYSKGVRTYHKLIVPRTLACPVCATGTEFSNLEDLQSHIRFHIPASASQGEELELEGS